MISPPTDEDINNSTEIEENTNALNKLIATIENKLVITEIKENYNDYNENEESEEENEKWVMLNRFIQF